MNNELLDLILDRLSNKHNVVILHTQAFLDENPEIRDNSGRWDAIKYLNHKCYMGPGCMTNKLGGGTF